MHYRQEESLERMYKVELYKIEISIPLKSSLVTCKANYAIYVSAKVHFPEVMCIPKVSCIPQMVLLPVK